VGTQDYEKEDFAGEVPQAFIKERNARHVQGPKGWGVWPQEGKKKLVIGRTFIL